MDSNKVLRVSGITWDEHADSTEWNSGSHATTSCYRNQTFSLCGFGLIHWWYFENCSPFFFNSHKSLREDDVDVEGLFPVVLDLWSSSLPRVFQRSELRFFCGIHLATWGVDTLVDRYYVAVFANWSKGVCITVYTTTFLDAVQNVPDRSALFFGNIFINIIYFFIGFFLPTCPHCHRLSNWSVSISSPSPQSA